MLTVLKLGDGEKHAPVCMFHGLDVKSSPALSTAPPSPSFTFLKAHRHQGNQATRDLLLRAEAQSKMVQADIASFNATGPIYLKHQYYRIIPKSILNGLSPAAVKVYLIHQLFDHPDEHSNTFISPTAIGLYGISQQTASKKHKQLVDAGYLKLLQRGHTGFCSHYGVVRPESINDEVWIIHCDDLRILLNSSIGTKKLRPEQFDSLDNRHPPRYPNKDLSTDIEFAHKIFPHLKSLRTNSRHHLYNLPCPLSNNGDVHRITDSQKHRIKKRGYLFLANDNQQLMFHSHNLGYSIPFAALMSQLGYGTEYTHALWKAEELQKGVLPLTNEYKILNAAEETLLNINETQEIPPEMLRINNEKINEDQEVFECFQKLFESEMGVLKMPVTYNVQTEMYEGIDEEDDVLTPSAIEDIVPDVKFNESTTHSGLFSPEQLKLIQMAQEKGCSPYQLDIHRKW